MDTSGQAGWQGLLSPTRVHKQDFSLYQKLLDNILALLNLLPFSGFSFRAFFFLFVTFLTLSLPFCVLHSAFLLYLLALFRAYFLQFLLPSLQWPGLFLLTRDVQMASDGTHIAQVLFLFPVFLSMKQSRYPDIPLTRFYQTRIYILSGESTGPPISRLSFFPSCRSATITPANTSKNSNENPTTSHCNTSSAMPLPKINSSVLTIATVPLPCSPPLLLVPLICRESELELMEASVHQANALPT
jgi:hypothetical protein